jgi:hypothetical protein
MNSKRVSEMSSLLAAIAALAIYPAYAFAVTVIAAALPDAFEDDDTPDRASFIGVDGDAQVHNFHDAGDQDWAQFYVPGPDIITIDTTDPGANADTTITIFEGDGTTQIGPTVDDVGPAQGEVLLFNVTEAGMYFVRVADFNPNTAGDGTEYTLRVFREQGTELPGTVAGTVRDAVTDDPIEGASVNFTISSQSGATKTTQSDGVYAFTGLPSGTYTLHASAGANYTEDSRQVTLAAGELENVDLILNPISTSSEDVNGSGAIDAVDVQLVINAALGLGSEFDCDIDNNANVDAVDVQLVINAALGL